MKTKKYDMPPGKEIIEPEGGWKEHTVYLVHVSMRPGNPIFKCLLHVGFLTESKCKKVFGGYCCIWANNCDETDASRVYFLEPVQELCKL